MSTVDVAGLRTNVQRMPAADGAPVVVFVHGLLADSLASYYFTLAPAFAAAGFDVLMYDMRGHGRSGRPATGYQVERFVDDLDGLLDALGVRAPVHLVGNSFGGTVAFGFAAAHPERTGTLTMIEGEPATAAWSAKMAANLRRATEELVRGEVLDWVSEEFGAHTARLARSAGTALNSTTLGTDIPASRVLTEAEVAAVACPVLAVYGDRSDLAEQAPWLAGALRACRTVVLPDHDHSILVERPGSVSGLIMDWIAGHSRPERAARAADAAG